MDAGDFKSGQKGGRIVTRCLTRLMNRYSRPDVLRILHISSRQLLGWERAGLIPSMEQYGFPEMAQLRTLRELQGLRMRPASIRNSVQAMKAVSGMHNPLMEAAVVRTGARLAFRHSGIMFDPIRRQFLFDFESSSGPQTVTVSMLPSSRRGVARDQELQALFLQAVQAEEQGRKLAAMDLYAAILKRDPAYTAALINLGTLHYHQKQYSRAEELYRRATEADPSYVLAFFDLGNVLDELLRPDESIAAYSRAIALAPGYADAHYNLALAYERKADRRRALMHWQTYVRLDRSGPWADHARGQITKLLSREKLSITHRTASYVPQGRRTASSLQLIKPDLAPPASA
jgi:tetratricopeptide (TPR) repeat protein